MLLIPFSLFIPKQNYYIIGFAFCSKNELAYMVKFVSRCLKRVIIALSSCVVLFGRTFCICFAFIPYLANAFKNTNSSSYVGFSIGILVGKAGYARFGGYNAYSFF